MASSSRPGQWSPWYNSDRPWIGTGDIETLKSIEHHVGPVCGFREKIEATQCQLTKYGQEFTDITAHTLKDELKIPCTNKGLLCQNSHQNSGICHDYAVRFLCTLSNDSDIRNEDGDYFPQFDARIYIILAVVPILVFILRVLWGFVFRRRRRQRRRRARRNGEDDDDSSSIASSLAHAPPSYHQLFGDLGTNRANGGTNSIFAITRNTITVCQGCKDSNCSVAVALCHSTSSNSNSQGSAGSSVVVIPVSGDTQQRIVQHSVRIEGDGTCSTQQPDVSSQPSTSHVVNSSSHVTCDTQTVITNNAQTARHSTSVTIEGEFPIAINSSDFNPQHSQSHTTAPVGEEILLKACNTPCLSNGISQPCPCACHRTVAISTGMSRSISTSGYDNGAFHGEGERVVPAHPEVPTLQRVYSNLSNGSVVTLSELPTYEDALDLIKKKEQKLSE